MLKKCPSSLILCPQTCTGHQGALREETRAGQQSLHGAQCHHAAAGGPGERAHEVRK